MSEFASEQVVSVSARGEVTIPEACREEAGIPAPGHAKFVHTGEGEIVVRPITSVTDLRGILAGESDDAGRSAVERLREEREPDAERAGAASALGDRTDDDVDGGFSDDDVAAWMEAAVEPIDESSDDTDEEE